MNAAPPQPADDLVQRAAEVLSHALDMDDYPDFHRSMPGAKALVDAGLLRHGPKLTDADRAVLDDLRLTFDNGATHDDVFDIVELWYRETQP